MQEVHLGWTVVVALRPTMLTMSSSAPPASPPIVTPALVRTPAVALMAVGSTPFATLPPAVGLGIVFPPLRVLNNRSRRVSSQLGRIAQHCAISQPTLVRPRGRRTPRGLDQLVRNILQLRQPHPHVFPVRIVVSGLLDGVELSRRPRVISHSSLVLPVRPADIQLSPAEGGGR